MGTCLYIILFSSANSRNKPRSISFSCFCFSTYCVKSKGISLGLFLIFFFNCLILILTSSFTSSICQIIWLNASILFFRSVFNFFNSLFLEECSRYFRFFCSLLRIVFLIVLISLSTSYIFLFFFSSISTSNISTFFIHYSSSCYFFPELLVK